jgi:hypothetical protein
LVCGMLLNCLLSVACFCLWLVWMKLLDKSYHTKQFFSHINYIFDQILCFCCMLQFDIFKIPKLLTYLQFVGRWSAGARQQKWAYKLYWIGFFSSPLLMYSLALIYFCVLYYYGTSDSLLSIWEIVIFQFWHCLNMFSNILYV